MLHVYTLCDVQVHELLQTHHAALHSSLTLCCATAGLLVPKAATHTAARASWPNHSRTGLCKKMPSHEGGAPSPSPPPACSTQPPPACSTQPPPLAASPRAWRELPSSSMRVGLPAAHGLVEPATLVTGVWEAATSLLVQLLRVDAVVPACRCVYIFFLACMGHLTTVQTCAHRAPK